MKNWMRAAILTLCGTLSLTMTSCTEEDNASNPVENPDQSKYTIEQLQTIAQGAWLDEMQLTATDNVRLYNIEEGGQCDIYDFAYNDEDEEDEIGSATTYNGTWSITRDLSKLHFIDQLNISGFELIGGLTIQVKMKIDENAEPYKFFAENGFKYDVEVKDTLAMLRNQQTGDMAFIDRNDANLIALIIETGQFSDKAATRAASKPVEYLNPVTLYSMFGKKLDNSSYIQVHYQGLNPRICDMSILGAGAAPTAYLTKEIGRENLIEFKRQYLSIEELWNLGVRYFDLGTIYEKGGYGFFDEDMKYLYPGVTPQKLFHDLNALLKKYPYETAIIMLDQAPNLDNKTMQSVSGWVYNQLKDEFGTDRLVLNYGPDLRLNDCRGKLVVMNNYEAPLADNPMGVCMRSLWSNDMKTGEIVFPNGKKAKATVQANTNVVLFKNVEKDQMITKCLKIADESAKSREPHWIINHMAGRLGIPGVYSRYFVNATMENPHTAKELLSRKYAKTGIMVVDYLGINDGDAFSLLNPPYGVDLIAPIIGANYHARKNHLISLLEGDVVK